MEPKQSWILVDSDPLLRTCCEDLKLPISNSDQENINKMVSYIDACQEGKEKEYDIRAGIAVAAPQIGFMKNVIYINFDFGDQHFKYLLANPKIISRSIGIAYLKSGEGCLSVIKEHKGYVPRNKSIIVKGYDLINNKEIQIKADGILSICLQHEIDHLSGILYYDHINKKDKFYNEPNWIGY